MASPIPEHIKKKAEELYGRYENLELVDPGTVWPAEDGNVLVSYRDKPTGVMLWLKVQPPNASEILRPSVRQL